MKLPVKVHSVVTMPSSFQVEISAAVVAVDRLSKTSTGRMRKRKVIRFAEQNVRNVFFVTLTAAHSARSIIL